MLDLVMVEERSRSATIRALPRLFTGTVARAPGVSIRRVRWVEIEGAAPMAFHVDGEAVDGGGRREGRVHPGALSVAVR